MVDVRKVLKKLEKKTFSKKKVKVKGVLKKKRATLVLKEHKAPSVLGDPNRFFKDSFEEDKRQFFFE